MVGLRIAHCLITGIIAATNAQAQPAPVVVKPVAKTQASAPAAQATKPKTAKLVAAPTSDLLVEGYSKIMLGTTHIGYTIQRFEYNPKTKEYSTIYYLKTQAPANDVIESLKARSTADLQPLSYQYTSLEGKKVRIVDATFKNGTMTTSSLENGQRKVGAPKKIAPGTFLASFLGYLMLQQKDGVKIGNKYTYQAIAEEDGNIYKGEAYVKSDEAVKGIPTFRILNTYKNVKFVSNFTAKGEVIATRSDAQDISTELMSNIQEATKGMSVNQNQLRQLFGDIPKGQENAVARKSPGEALGGEARSKSEILSATPTPTEPSKTEGFPQGRGVQIKGQPKDDETP